jgi:hypothetical protein
MGSTKLCKWKSKKIEKSFDEYSELVKEPSYICTKCGRASCAKKNLCKPQKITS